MQTWLDTVRDLMTPAVFEQARAEEAAGRDPADFLLRGRHLTPAQVLVSLSQFHDVPAVLLGTFHPREDAIAKVPEGAARRYRAMPLFVARGRIYVAVKDPGDITAVDWLSQEAGMPVEEIVSTAGSIEQAINHCYVGEKRAAVKMRALTVAAQAARADAPAQGPVVPGAPAAGAGGLPVAAAAPVVDEEAPTVQMVNHSLDTAIRLGASDVHLEGFDDGAMLRYRVDGVLREYPPPPSRC